MFVVGLGWLGCANVRVTDTFNNPFVTSCHVRLVWRDCSVRCNSATTQCRCPTLSATGTSSESPNAAAMNDPLAQPNDHFTNDVRFYPSLDFADIRDYLVHGTSFVTQEQLKSYKSLEAHNYITSGLVEPPRVKVRDVNVIVIGKVGCR